MKTFVLDTNVLLYDPSSVESFEHSVVVIPVSVIEELDKMKRVFGELGKNARAVFRFLDSLHYRGNFHEGIQLENGALIRLLVDPKPPKDPELTLDVRDNKILMTALALQKEGHTVVFVSKDLAARLKAEAIGLLAEDYESLKFAYNQLYKGVKTVSAEKKEIDLFYKDGIIALPDATFKPNEYCLLTSPERTSAVAKYDVRKEQLVPLIKSKDIWGIQPRNVQQRCAIDALLRDDIPLVTLMGPAGTGKTLLALACALRKVFDEAEYRRILISRPVIPLGRDIGYLPGTKEEKLFPWMQPIYDNLEFLCEATTPRNHWEGREGKRETLQWVMDSDKIEMEAVTYIRGRSLPRMFIIIDEAQNLTPHEVKTVISRAGDGTKVVLTGDPTQIDNPYLDKDSNGLTYTVGKFQDHPLFGHIFLEKTERSILAAVAADLM